MFRKHTLVSCAKNLPSLKYMSAFWAKNSAFWKVCWQ